MAGRDRRHRRDSGRGLSRDLLDRRPLSPMPRLFGLAIASSSPAVAARCAHARAGVGAVATQNITDPPLGPRILMRLRSGAPARRRSTRARLHAPSLLPAVLALGARWASGRRIPVRMRSASWRFAIGAISGGGRQSAGDPDEVPAGDDRRIRARAGTSGRGCRRRMRAGGRRRRSRSDPLGGLAGGADHAGRSSICGSTGPSRSARALPLWNLYAPQIEDYVRRALDPGAAELRRAGNPDLLPCRA